MRQKADAKPPRSKVKPKGKITATAKKAVKRKPAAAKKAAVVRAKPERSDKRGVTRAVSRSEVFVQEYLLDLNGRQAAIRAGYSPDSARQMATELLATPKIHDAVVIAMAERAKRTGIDQDQVLQRYWAIATADPRDLVELYRACCRYCWSENHRYHFTAREMEEARELHEADETKQLPFDERGGTGFNPRKDPNPACPECFGDGEERVFAKDTRDLSPQARVLFAGVKTTQHGMEIKAHDQMAALRDVGKHLGMFKNTVELTGKDGKDFGAGIVVVPAKRARGEPIDAQAAIASALANTDRPDPPAIAKKREFKVLG